MVNTITDFDAIVIGGGIGGTAAGALLASKGYKILLVEKNDIIGGRCSTYEKQGFKVDVGVHSFGRAHKGPLGEVLNRLGMEDQIEWIPCKNPGPRWHHQGKIIKFPHEFRQFVDDTEFRKLMRIIGKVMTMKDTSKLDDVSLKSWVSKYTSNTVIHSFFNVIGLFYFVIPYYEASAGEFIRCLATLTNDMSTSYPVGGCVEIPSIYSQGIEKYGGRVIKGKKVKRIIIENDEANGIELENGEIYTCKNVISNSGIKETAKSLIGEEYFDKGYIDKISKLTYSLSALGFKIALKKPITDLKVLISFSNDDPEEKYRSIIGGNVPKEVDFFVPIPSNYDSSVAPDGKQLITAGTIVPRDSFETNKQKWIKNSMESLEAIFPDINENIMWYDITAPSDIENLGGKDAAVIGISQSVSQSGVNRPSSILPIDGIYIVGGDAGGWGIGTEMAVKSAIDATNEIMKKI